MCWWTVWKRNAHPSLRHAGLRRVGRVCLLVALAGTQPRAAFLGIDADRAHGALRISMGRYTDEADVEAFAVAMEKSLNWN